MTLGVLAPYRRIGIGKTSTPLTDILTITDKGIIKCYIWLVSQRHFRKCLLSWIDVVSVRFVGSCPPATLGYVFCVMAGERKVLWSVGSVSLTCSTAVAVVVMAACVVRVLCRIEAFEEDAGAMQGGSQYRGGVFARSDEQ